MEPAPAPGLCRCPRPSPQFRGDRIKLKALGRDGISIDRETIDLRYVEQLIDSIWGYDASVEPGVVWTYMSYLRRKLEALESKTSILMRRGFGYVLEERR